MIDIIEHIYSIPCKIYNGKTQKELTDTDTDTDTLYDYIFCVASDISNIEFKRVKEHTKWINIHADEEEIALFEDTLKNIYQSHSMPFDSSVNCIYFNKLYCPWNTSFSAI